jgi:hypothetical protein
MNSRLALIFFTFLGLFGCSNQRFSGEVELYISKTGVARSFNNENQEIYLRNGQALDSIVKKYRPGIQDICDAVLLRVKVDGMMTYESKRPKLSIEHVEQIRRGNSEMASRMGRTMWEHSHVVTHICTNS